MARDTVLFLAYISCHISFCKHRRSRTESLRIDKIRQLPSNIVLRILGARLWLTICVVGWGASQLGMGFVSAWGYLALTRVFLGVFEVSDQIVTL